MGHLNLAAIYMWPFHKQNVHK